MEGGHGVRDVRGNVGGDGVGDVGVRDGIRDGGWGWRAEWRAGSKVVGVPYR